MYLKPDDVDIKDPPIMVKRIKNKDISKLEAYVVIPDVDIDEITANNILKIPSFGIIKK